MYCEDPFRLSSELDCGELMNQWNSSGFVENWASGSISVKQSLVLDDEKGELVKDDSKRKGKKIEVSETKTIAALKSHSDAERRRRVRINAHLETLRGLVPNKEKMDKATLLAEVVNQIKQLKTSAKEVSEGLHIPMDTDNTEVEMLENNMGDGSLLIRASLCCDYRPDLLSDLRRAINDLRVRVLNCEISTLGGRVKIVFLITTCKENNESEITVGSIRAVLCDILDKVSASAEYAQPLLYPRKRQRVSYFDSSCS